MTSNICLKNLKIIRNGSFSSALNRKLLNYQAQAPFQTPLLAENGIVFFEKWFQQQRALPFSSFVPQTQTFSTENQNALLETFQQTVKMSFESHHTENLYLALGFILWFDPKSPNTPRLSPTLLVPLNWISETNSVKISNKLPIIENIPLRLKWEETVSLPKVSDAFSGAQFDIRRYFSLLEKSIEEQKKWKISAKGISVCFLNSSRLHSFSDLENSTLTEGIEDNSIFSSLLGENGFQHQASSFEEKPVDDYFRAAEHHFIYTPDSSSTFAIMDSLYGKHHLYCIQAPIGTTKYETLANILSEAVAQDKKTLVVSNKTISQQKLITALHPPAFEYQSPQNRVQILKDFSNTQDLVKNYYQTVNALSSGGKISLGESMRALSEIPASKKAKAADEVFQGSEHLSKKEYEESQTHLHSLIELLNQDQASLVQDYYQGFEILGWNQEKKSTLNHLLEDTLQQCVSLQQVTDVLSENPYFKEFKISTFVQIDQTAKEYFSKSTPTFNQWNLLSKDWDVYADDFLALPDAGIAWTNYRRIGSPLFNDDAIEENVYADRTELQENSDKTFKLFSEKYRESKKRLLKLFKDPQKIKDDEELLKHIDNLIRLQEQRKLFRTMSTLAHRLCGEDWSYEKTKWNSFHSKIRWFLHFRKKIKDNPSYDFILALLSSNSALEAVLPSDKALSDLYSQISSNLIKIKDFIQFPETFPDQLFESLFYTLQQWKKGIDFVDLYIQIQKEIKALKAIGLHNLLKEASLSKDHREELSFSYTRFWYSLQVQDICKNYPSLFSLSPITCNKTEKEYRRLYDLLNVSNYQYIQEKLQKTPQLIQWKFYNEVRFDLPLQKELFDLIIFTDADNISVSEALPIFFRASQTILAGNTHHPFTPPILFEREEPTENSNTYFPEQESIFSFALKQGCRSASLTLCKEYRHPALFDFANREFYQKELNTLPQTSEKVFSGIKIQPFPQPQNLLINAIISHAESSKNLSLGVLVFSEERLTAVKEALKIKIEENPDIRDFFEAKDIFRDFYIKLPEDAIEETRDTLFILAESSHSIAHPKNGSKIIHICATHALQQLIVFTDEVNSSAKSSMNPGIQAYRNWLQSIQNPKPLYTVSDRNSPSPLISEVMSALSGESLSTELHWSYEHSFIGAVVRDANNPHRFLVAIEDDSMNSSLRKSINDVAYIRPLLLQRLGWKVIRLWTPVWFLSTAEESDHLITSIAIEQSVAPPPEQVPSEEEAHSEEKNSFNLQIEPYEIKPLSIEGTEHEKPIPELTPKQLVFQMRHYIDQESPIHENCLKKRLLDLHQVKNPGPKIKQVLNEAVALGLQKKAFIQTGHFFYSQNQKPTRLRDRSQLSEEERLFTYLSPEERAILPASMSDSEIKEALGLI